MTQSYRDGLEAAAKLAEEQSFPFGQDYMTALQIAQAIRSLPVPPEPEVSELVKRLDVAIDYLSVLLNDCKRTLEALRSLLAQREERIRELEEDMRESRNNALERAEAAERRGERASWIDTSQRLLDPNAPAAPKDDNETAG